MSETPANVNVYISSLEKDLAEAREKLRIAREALEEISVTDSIMYALLADHALERHVNTRLTNPSSAKYRDNYDRIFGPHKSDLAPCSCEQAPPELYTRWHYQGSEGKPVYCWVECAGTPPCDTGPCHPQDRPDLAVEGWNKMRADDKVSI